MNTAGSEFRNFRVKSSNRDFVLRLENEYFYTNRDFLCKDFECSNVDDDLDEFTFEDPQSIKVSDVEAVLKFLHAAECRIPTEHWQGAMEIAYSLGSNILMEGIATGIAQRSTTANVVGVLRALRWYRGSSMDQIFQLLLQKARIPALSKEDYEYISNNPDLVKQLYMHSAQLAFVTKDASFVPNLKIEHRTKINSMQDTFFQAITEDNDPVLLKISNRWASLVSPVLAIALDDQEISDDIQENEDPEDEHINDEHKKYLQMMIMNSGWKVWPMFELFYPTAYSIYLRFVEPDSLSLEFYPEEHASRDLSIYERALRCMSISDQLDISAAQSNVYKRIIKCCSDKSPTISNEQALDVGFQFSYLPLISFGLKKVNREKYIQLIKSDAFKVLGKEAVLNLLELVLFG